MKSVTPNNLFVWWGRPLGPTGHMFEMASVQAFQDFLASGPPVSAPPQVVEELRALLLGHNLSSSPAV
jgi:hypothetical protein